MKTMPFIDKLKYWAAHDGRRTAVIVGEKSLDYAGLLQAAEERAAACPAAGVAVIEQPTSVELIIDFCAARLGGRTAMVLDAAWPAVLRAQLSAAAEQWPSSAGAGVGYAGAGVLLKEPFLLGLSSGTSGLPKAFVRCTDSWHESFVSSSQYFELKAQDVTFAPGPLAASMNLYALGESIHAGSTFVALPYFSADAALETLATHAVNRLVVVPTVLEMLAARSKARGENGASLESVVCAGSALSDRTLMLATAWAPHARIQHYYGAAELGFVAASSASSSAGHPSSEAVSRAVAVGTAFPGVEISIRNDQGQQVTTGQQGNICVRSPYLCSGYAWGDDGLAFGSLASDTSGETRQPWFSVRDQGRLDGDGVLHVVGRASEMIINAGANVYPHAVEEALSASCGAAATVMVAGIADPLRGERVVAGIFEPRGRAHVDLPALRLAAARLPAPQRPSGYYLLQALPLTRSGKPSRELLNQWITEGDSRAQRLR